MRTTAALATLSVTLLSERSGEEYLSPESILSARAQLRAIIPGHNAMVAALQKWKCQGCGGRGTYWQNHRDSLRKFESGKELDVHYNPAPTPCKRCNGHKLEPIARAALIAAGVIKEEAA